MRALLSLALLGCSAGAAASGPRADEGPVVVELFTSQGCSSCPPADAFANKLVKDGALNGRAVVPLTFHVDYWDELGWPDPFASAAWTERQREYAAQLRDHVYTPELVIAGTRGVVGSNVMLVSQAVAAAPAQAHVVATAAWSTSGLRVDATAPADADVFVAIWQDGTRTKVPRGENAGETMASDHVVRRLVRVARAGKREQQDITLDPAWGTNLGAIAFAQREDRAIVGAMLLPRGR